MFLDDSYGYTAIQNFASAIDTLDSKEKEFFEKYFHDDQSTDFYLGLLSGYANSYALCNKNLKPSEFEKIIIFLADRIAKRGL